MTEKYQFEPNASDRYPLDTRKSKGNEQRGDGQSFATFPKDADDDSDEPLL